MKRSNSGNTMISEGRAHFAGFNTRELRCVGSGPTFVLLHGIFDSADTWSGLLATLASRGHSAVAVDLPGYGQADRRQPGPGLAQLDAFVRDLVQAEGASEPAVLVGNSLGGNLTVRAALDPTLPISAAIPIDTAGLGYRPLIESLIGRYSPPSALVSRIPWLDQIALSRQGVKFIARSLYAAPTTADLEAAARMATMLGTERGFASIATEGRAMLREMDGGFDTGEVPPMVVVHRRRVNMIPSSAALRLHRQFPGSELRILDHCGHCPQLDDPTLIAELITNFALRQPQQGQLRSSQAGL